MQFGQMFIDVWNLYSDCITDTNHINAKGHQILLKIVTEALNEQP